jgi:vancomycin resistance protein YoaR
MNDFLSGINNLVGEHKTSLVVDVAYEIIKPEFTLSTANDFGIIEKIGQGQSDYSGSISERIHNIILASSKFHGILIPKDEIFSFNKTVGDISALTGYKPAYIIKNGRTVLGDGGGVCQVSTTLFRAAINTGLPIIERVSHAYRVHYYENDGKPGFDATVFNPSADLKFKNDTSAYILIQTEIDKTNNILTFMLYGKKDNRIAQISDAKVWDVLPPPEPLYQDDPTLKKGITKQIDWSSWGAKAIFHYKVEKEGKTIADQDFFSQYRPWQAVFLVGTAD